MYTRSSVYRAKKRNNTPVLTKQELALVNKYYKLSNMLGINYHVDHIKPVSKGGPTHPSNLQILTAEDNMSKGAKLNYTYKHPRITLGGNNDY